MSSHRRRLIASAGACMALAGTILPLVGAQSASAAPPATAYSGDAYGVGIFNTSILGGLFSGGLVSISDTKIGEVGPFNGPNPQSGSTSLVTACVGGINVFGQCLGGIHVGASVAKQTVTEGNNASSASSKLVGANIGFGLTNLITADLLSVKTAASCSGPPTASTNLVNLRVAGVLVNANVSPNTKVTVTLGGQTAATVTLNEETFTTAGNDSMASASSVVVDFPAGGALSGIIVSKIVVAHAESDVSCSPAVVPVPVSVGYADTVPNRPPPFTPTPWLGAPNVNFVGTGPDWDAGAVKVDNPSAVPEFAKVTVDVGTNHFDLWGYQTVPANGSLVVTQTGHGPAGPNGDNFDTSELGSQNCSAPSTVIPVVHVTINGVTTDHLDTARVLITGGFDRGMCPTFNGNEGIQYTPTT